MNRVHASNLLTAMIFLSFSELYYETTSISNYRASSVRMTGER
jgi:hypothetical protein